MTQLTGAIEAGGTKFICAIGRDHTDIIKQIIIPTTTPAETLAACAAFFTSEIAAHGPIGSLGIAAFGPLDLDPTSDTYGALLDTPKPGWSGTNFIRYFSEKLKVPVVLDTDVNGAVLAEVLWGAAQGCENAVYVTVGTGIGGGVYAGGKLVHGLMHPEIGHIPMPRAIGDDSFQSDCPFHDDCLEGLASGPAIEKRWKTAGQALADNHPAWGIEAYYLSQMCRSITLTLSPQKIILGGGVMAKSGLMQQTRLEFDRLMAGYVPIMKRAGSLENYIVSQSFDGTSGLAGAFALTL